MSGQTEFLHGNCTRKIGEFFRLMTDLDYYKNRANSVVRSRTIKFADFDKIAKKWLFNALNNHFL